MATTIIPGTDLPLPTPWDLMQAGLSTGDYILSRHGEQAHQAWLESGAPTYTEPSTDWAAEDLGIMRRGWHGPRYRK
jgi:hypothetical protein